MLRSDEDVETHSDQLRRGQKDVLVVTRQVLLQVLSPLLVILGAFC